MVNLLISEYFDEVHVHHDVHLGPSCHVTGRRQVSQQTALPYVKIERKKGKIPPSIQASQEGNISSL